jgi:hypothetical protein
LAQIRLKFGVTTLGQPEFLPIKMTDDDLKATLVDAFSEIEN